VQDANAYSTPQRCACILLIVKLEPQADAGSNRMWV